MKLLPTHPDRLAASRGFSVMELLVVVLIVSIIAGVAVVGTNTMFAASRRTNAEMITASAVGQARAFATSPRSMVTGEFRGAAALFTASSEIRLIIHDERVRDSRAQYDYLYENGMPGYTDLVERETGKPYRYIPMPQDIGVVGITRGNSGQELLPPPFAIRFNRDGVLIAAKTGSDENLVYYDGRYDGDVETTVDRSGSYNADAYDPESTYYDKGAFNPWNNTADKYEVGFEKVETVLGVVVYSKSEFETAGHSLGGDSSDLQSDGSLTNSGSSNPAEWLMRNGKIMMFDRYSGEVIRERPQQ